jgi:hypothetical protein
MMWEGIRARRLALIGLGLGWTLAVMGIAAPADAGDVFTATPLATDATDSQLVNPWGISTSGMGPFWISDNGAGVSTLYSIDPSTNVATKVTSAPNGVKIPEGAAPQRLTISILQLRYWIIIQIL